MASDLFDEAGQRFNLDPKLLRSVFQVESGSNFDTPDSSAGAMGGMQLMPQTYASLAQKYGLGSDPHDPTNNVMAGAAALSENLSKFGNIPDALRAYNGGYDQSKWVNAETSAYPGKVASAYAGMSDPAQNGTQVAEASTGTMTDATSSNAPDPDSFARQWGIGMSAPSGASAQSTTSPDAPAADTSAFEQQWGLGGPAAVDVPTNPTPAPPTPQPQGGVFSRLKDEASAGLGRGIRDIADVPAEYLAKGSDAIGLTPALQSVFGSSFAPDAQQQAASNQNALSSFNQNYGSSPVAALARVGGNALMTAPVAAGAAGAVGRAANALAPEATGLTNALVQGGRLIGQGAAAGAAAGATTATGSGQDIGTAAEQGAALGGALGPVAAGLSSAGRSVLGGMVSPQRAAMAKTAMDQYGIPLTAPQISGSTGIKYAAGAADILGGHTGPTAEDQLGAFTKAVSQSFGENSPTITQPVVNSAYTRLGQTFDNIAKSTSINADDQLVGDLGNIETAAHSVLLPQEVTPLSNQLNGVLSSVGQDGTISGQTYQALTRKGAPLDRLMSSDNPNVSYYGGQIRDALDDALGRSLVSNGQQDLLSQLQDARFQYKNLKTVEPLINKSGGSGTVSPLLLQGRVNAQFPNRAQTGAGPLGDLADIGQTFFRDAPNSGTAQRAAMIGRVGELGAAVAAAPFNPSAAATGAGLIGAQMLGGKLVGSALNSAPVANALVGRSLAGAAPGLPLSITLGSGAVVPIVNRLAAGQPQ